MGAATKIHLASAPTIGRTSGFGFNLKRQSADDGVMSDVDAIRFMASERDLEFVDLDTYGVDPAACEILPVALARRHHMVAIKRKSVSYTHLRAHETRHDLVCRLLL